MGNFYGLRGTRLNIAIAVIAGTDFALFGYDQGVMGGLLTLKSFLKYFPQIDVASRTGAAASRASNVQGITVGGYTLGCFFGAVATIWLGNMLGRKKTIMVGSSIRSPRWLALKGRDAEALQVLAALSDLPEEDQSVQDEFRAVKDTVFEMARGSFSDVFKTNRNRNLHRTILAYVNQMFQQISGINIITYYAATIFENNIGLSPFLSRLLAALNGTEYFFASFIAIFTIERFGRRKLMLFGAAGQALSMAVLAGTTSVKGSSTGIGAAVFLFVFNSFFAVGWLGMTWLYPAEIVSLDIRAPANAISTTANWIFNFMVVMVTPVAFNSIGYKTYIVFMAINAFMVPCVYFFFPETAYRSLEEMDEIFHKVHGLRGALDVVKVAREQPHRYGKKGELLIPWDDTEEARDVARRRSSVVAPGGGRAGHDIEKAHGSDDEAGEKKEIV
ncbi:hypothetical protein LTR78_006535 [Recurvomyces mirabilis]|uniref:Major facilitator superfamily (MFS) profile domain-containing protein n=1 Tax=Recurvomyces mirabilis TaxID=574656 RepID=A0AAE0WL03_9PEZI|nr:hypothetical protein LTR78_006535 [Recurvomyces mirabilis]